MTIIPLNAIRPNGLCSFFTTTEQSALSNGEDYLKLITKYIEPGNIIPNSWYKKIIDKKNRPDFTAIILLSEILALYRFAASNSDKINLKKIRDKPILKGRAICISYMYFTKKFNITKDKVRRAFVKLEELNIIERGVSNIQNQGGGRCNKLMLGLELTFLQSCFRNVEKDIRVPLTHEMLHSSPRNQEKSDNLFNNCYIQSQQISTHHISNKTLYKKNRSMKPDSSESGSNILKFHLKERKLLDFYPLSNADASELQSSSGRQFSQNAMNEILHDMAKRLGNRVFKSKKAFMSYMGKVYANEMRDAVKVSNMNFKIKKNQSTETINLHAQERYLADIENSLEVSPEWHLKKKLACVFVTTKSYNLLRAYSSVSREGGSFKLYLDKQIELTELDKEIILKQVKATHERLDTNDKRLGYIDELEIIMPKATHLNEFSNGSKQKSQQDAINIPVGIWGRVRESLKSVFGEATDKNWFSKLEATIHEETKEIKLTAPTSFVKDWIKANYLEPIEKITSQINYKVFLS